MCLFYDSRGKSGQPRAPCSHPSGCRAGEHEQSVPSAPARAPQIPESYLGTAPKPLLPREQRYRLAGGTLRGISASPVMPGMPEHLSVWLAVVFSCGKASDYPESPNRLCLAVSSAQALSSVFLPDANARSWLTCDELVKRVCSASRSNKLRLCPLNLSMAGTSAAVGATLVTWA